MTQEGRVPVSIFLWDHPTGTGNVEIAGAIMAGAGIIAGIILGTTLGATIMAGAGIMDGTTVGVGMTLGIVLIAGTDGITMAGMVEDTTMPLLHQQLLRM